jgi:DNA-binding transcriptional regulator YiaG
MTKEQIKRLRESFGYTMDEFAFALGYRHKQRASNISRWESGAANPPPPAFVLMKQMASKKQ